MPYDFHSCRIYESSMKLIEGNVLVTEAINYSHKGNDTPQTTRYDKTGNNVGETGD